MSSKPFNTREFKELLNQWYDKLENDGFVDIERHPEKLHTDTAKFRDMGATIAFYDRLTQYFYQATFTNLIDKAVIMYYADGLSMREIARILKMSRPKVKAIISKHLNIMGESNYEYRLE